MKINVSDTIILREISLEDSADIFRTIDTQRAYLGKWLPFVEFSKSMDFSKAFIQSILDTPFEFRDHTFVVLYEGEFAGVVGFKGTDRANRKTEIGYWLSETYQKMGIISNSVVALMKYAYNELGMNRIQIRCGIGNIPSRSIPIRLGFQLEGIERA
jgi:ribosomal-protein-serine acetyltransferase